MSDKKPAHAKTKGNPPTSSARRISQPRPKKPSSSPVVETAAPATPAPADEIRPALDLPPATSIAPPASTPETSAGPDDWPEPDAPDTGGRSSPDVKRKRRRRKGKGQGQGQAFQAHSAPAASEESQPPDDDDAGDEPPTAATTPPVAPKPARAPQPPPRQHASRAPIDPEILSRKAWKIFLAEVSEEGVALIGDQDARELARRCFRLAEIFIEEQARHLPGNA